jgi:hypothetical protein
MNKYVEELVNTIQLADTHEHLNEESEQLKDGDG